MVNIMALQLRTSADKLLDAIDDQCSDLLGVSNYIWNTALTKFACEKIKQKHLILPIIAGGPNVKIDTGRCFSAALRSVNISH